MGKAQSNLIMQTAEELGLRFYDYGSYVLVLDTMGEELKCKTNSQLLDWIGE